MKPTLVVLAAGMGSRYGGLKQMDGFGPSGETIIEYSVYDAIRAGFGKIVFVIRKEIEADFRERFGERFESRIQVEYVYQELNKIPAGLSVPADRTKPWGTGHALLMAAEKVNEPFAVINADDFYGKESFQIIANFLNTLQNSDMKYCIVGYHVKNTLSEFGSVSRGVCENDAEGNMTSITERTKIYTKGNEIVYEEEGVETALDKDQLVSMNLMGFAPSAFEQYQNYFETFIKANYSNPKAEFYMPFVLNSLVDENKAVVKLLSTPDKWFGVTYKEDKPVAVASLEALIQAGLYPDNLWK